MTPKQNAFCREMATPDGRGHYRPQHECYRLAFGCTELSAKRQVVELMKRPEIRERVAELRQQVEDEVWERAKRAPIAVKANRLIAKQERHDRLRDLIEARSREGEILDRQIEELSNELVNLDPEEKSLSEQRVRLKLRISELEEKRASAYDTGILARETKSVGAMENNQIVDVYRLDKAALDALNDLENDAAKELGQITEKKDITSGGKAFKALVAVDIDAV